MIVVRYADDTIVGFQRQADATKLLDDLKERLATFALEPLLGDRGRGAPITAPTAVCSRDHRRICCPISTRRAPHLFFGARQHQPLDADPRPN
jgi:hypothetical protein